MKLSGVRTQGVPIAPATWAKNLAKNLVKALAVILAATICAGVACTSAASARGHDGIRSSGRGAIVNGGSFAAGRRHGNDAYVKAASQERDRLLKKLKDICRGC